MRQLIYDKLSTIPEFVRVHQGESLTAAPKRERLPIAVYRIGNESPDNIGAGATAHRVYFQVYIHDKPADYSRIDDLVVKVQNVFDLDGSVGEVVEIIYLETSRDLDDAFFGSIMRYVRFQAVLAH